MRSSSMSPSACKVVWALTLSTSEGQLLSTVAIILAEHEIYSPWGSTVSTDDFVFFRVHIGHSERRSSIRRGYLQ